LPDSQAARPSASPFSAFPFSAIVGQERLKRALLACADPKRLPVVLAVLPQMRVIGRVSATPGVRLNSGQVLRQGFDHFAKP